MSVQDCEWVFNSWIGVSDLNNLWYFATLTGLTIAHPTASAWNYALVGATDSFRVWDDWTLSWVDSWSWTNVLQKTDKFVITNTDITNWYIDLSKTPLLTRHITLYYDGLEEWPAIGINPNDGMRTLLFARITFNDVIHDLYVWAKLDIKYSY